MTAFVYEPPAAMPIVLYEDTALLAVSKPAGLLSVPGRLPEHQDSALTRLETHFGPLGVVHRLDMDTSGILLFSRKAAALSHLHRQFSDRNVSKRYDAWVEGTPNDDQGLIDQPLICDWPNRPRQKIDADLGKPSQTQWQVQLRCGLHTKATLTPITGRSHQLRVHMQFLGHPILGDRFYGGGSTNAKRLMLHARYLGIEHPETGQRLTLDDQSENRLEERHLINAEALDRGLTRG